MTQACDLSCDHCRADARPARHPCELTTEEGRRLLEDARRFGENQLVVFSGGDPLKRPDVAELVSYGTDLGLEVTLTPSGTAALSTTRLEELQRAGLRRVALSLDGATAETHDAFRGEAGSFAETVAAIEAANDRGLPVQVNTTVCDATIEELSAIRELLETMDVVLWSVFFLVPVGRGRHLDPVDPARAEAVMHWLYEIDQSASFRIKTTEAPHYRRVRPERDGLGPADHRGPAGIAGDGFAFVSHTGEVYPSGFLPVSAGNVRDRSITEIYREGSLFRRLRDRDELVGKCGVCPYRFACGESRSRAFATSGDPFDADPLCPYRPPGYRGPVSSATH